MKISVKLSNKQNFSFLEFEQRQIILTFVFGEEFKISEQDNPCLTRARKGGPSKNDFFANFNWITDRT